MGWCIKIDLGLCQGHSVCEAEAPEIFRVIETDGAYPQVELIIAEPDDALREKAEKAAKYCPNGVIKVVEL